MSRLQPLFFLLRQHHGIRGSCLISKWSVIQHLGGFPDNQFHIGIAVMGYDRTCVDLLKKHSNCLGA